MAKLSEIAAALGGEIAGDGQLTVEGVDHPASARPTDLALAMEEDALAALPASRAKAAILKRGCAAPDGLSAVIYVDHPRYALAGLTRLFARPPYIAPGIHPSSLIDPTAVIGDGSAIGPFVQIGPGARVGPRAVILGQSTIGAGARIGADALIHPGVRIGERVEIGDRAILHNNASIGADGFSFAIPGPGEPPPPGQPPIQRIASLGTVVIGDDVEVGANSCIDRGTIEATRIGSGSKIDNLVMIGHNNRIGRSCLIAGRVGISGSCRIGDGVILAGGVGIADHVTIGDGAVVLAGAQVGSNRIAPGAVVIGMPAIAKEKFFEQVRHLHRLKKLFADVAELKARLANAKEGD
ncbi:MAG TPA: UDP-3-O-(3-hydroxymyristoyl)glucosamine N-acyltransferase [Candidatus Udaeobacter sp.]|nr:UDP-3-O-(3-hydroxymyristoyl)glucosamine N-acyltransferase [Candidatus Udaeobacter sp.]